MEKTKVVVEGKNGFWEFDSVKDASKYVKKRSILDRRNQGWDKDKNLPLSLPIRRIK